MIVIAFALTAAYYFGWVHRFVLYFLEKEASKILNNTPVTVGAVELDILRGNIWISDVIIHSPRREQWRWESPALARIGRAYIESNVLAILLRFWLTNEEIPLDLNSIEISDVQVFVERKEQIFNFYLLDPHVNVPDPVWDESEDRQLPAAREDEEDSSWMHLSTTETASATSSNTALASGNDEDVNAAQKLVDDMLRAIGRAAKKGTIQEALSESRLSITNHLRALQQSTSKSTQVMQEGVKLVQHVSKQFAEKERQLQKVVQPSRKPSKKDKIVYARVGRIILLDARIFTRDFFFEGEDRSRRGVANDNDGDDDSDVDGDDNDKTSTAASAVSTTTTAASASMQLSSSWGKPIHLKRVFIRASDLSPSVMIKDTSHALQPPAVYQPLDRVIEVIQRRILAEIAKSNTGRVFQTALGEMVTYWMEQSRQDGSVTAANDTN